MSRYVLTSMHGDPKLTQQSLRGHHASALVHLDNGVQLLLELQPAWPSPLSATPTYPAYPYTPLHSVGTVLTRLDTQATQLLPGRRTIIRPPPPPPTYHFTTLASARRASDALWNYSLYTLQPSPLSHPHPDHPADCARRHAHYAAALADLLARSPPRCPRDALAANVLRIHTLVGTLSLSPDYRAKMDDEGVWEAHEATFAEIVALTAEVVGTGAGAARVGVDTGVVGPLYLVATRCRHGVLRRRAVELLRVAPRMEGLWDGVLLARVAEGVVGIEEWGAGEGRVSDVDVEFDLEGRRAEVRYLQQLGDVTAVDKARRDVIEW